MWRVSIFFGKRGICSHTESLHKSILFGGKGRKSWWRYGIWHYKERPERRWEVLSSTQGDACSCVKESGRWERHPPSGKWEGEIRLQFGTGARKGWGDLETHISRRWDADCICSWAFKRLIVFTVKHHVLVWEVPPKKKKKDKLKNKPHTH